MLAVFNNMKILLKTTLELNEISTRVFSACGTIAHKFGGADESRYIKFEIF